MPSRFLCNEKLYYLINKRCGMDEALGSSIVFVPKECHVPENDAGVDRGKTQEEASLPPVWMLDA
jgi:hypothetical protein